MLPNLYTYSESKKWQHSNSMTGKYVSKPNQFVFISYPLYFLLSSPCSMSGLVQVLSCAEQSPGQAQLVHPVHPQHSMGEPRGFFLFA